MKILVISDNYPSSKFPNTGVFIYHLVQEMCKAGHEVSVISPQIFAPRKFSLDRFDYGEENARVYRPFVLSFGARKLVFFNTYLLVAMQQKFLIRWLIKRKTIRFDVVYTQFISNGLIAALTFPRNRNIFVDVGEYFNIDKVENWYGKAGYKTLLNRINAFVAVSPFVKTKLLEKGIKDERILMMPNGVNQNRFYYRNKKDVRIKLGLPLDEYIAIFVGHFIHTKGPLKLLEAAKIDGSTKLLFLGNGTQNNLLDSELILYKGIVPNPLVPEYLAAADVFVLPTHHEGSNNSILEAMACGLPIISSDLPEIRIQTNTLNSILVDPMNSIRIAEALKTLRQDVVLRQNFSEESLKLAANNTVKRRYESIIDFIEKFKGAN